MILGKRTPGARFGKLKSNSITLYDDLGEHSTLPSESKIVCVKIYDGRQISEIQSLGNERKDDHEEWIGEELSNKI